MRASLGNPRNRNIAIFLLICIAISLTFLVYSPGLSGTFVFDDYPNIVANSNLSIQKLDLEHIRTAAFSSDSGPLHRPISMLSFAANYFFTGSSPYYFKLTNFAIHAINGVSLYFLSKLLLGAYNRKKQLFLSSWHLQIISLATSAAWMLHPFNLTAVLYVVQRMTSLSSMFTIWGMIAFTWGRIQQNDGKSGVGWLLSSILLFLPLALFSKESSALLPVYLLAIELTIFGFSASRPAGRRLVIAFFGASVMLPALGFVTYTAFNPSWLTNGYTGRDFTLVERAMTEPRILLFYLREILLPKLSDMGLFHDDLPVSHSLLDPVSTLPCIAALLMLLTGSWFARKKAGLISFGILFFFSGHLLESTIFPLEITFEHRNYLPMYGILLALFYYLLYPLRFQANLRLRQVVGLVLILLLGMDTWSRAQSWANPFRLAKNDVDNHPQSVRDNSEMGNNYASISVSDPTIAEAYYQTAIHYYEQSTALDSNSMNGLFAVIILSSAHGRTIDPIWIAKLRNRLEFSPLKPDTSGNLMKLLECQAQKRCSLDNQILLDLINAGLRNSTAVGARRAPLLSSLTFYLVNLSGDYQQALSVMYQIVQIDPTQLEPRLTLIKFLLAMQKPEEARIQLAQVRQFDKLGVRREQIAKIEQALTNQ